MPSISLAAIPVLIGDYVTATVAGVGDDGEAGVPIGGLWVLYYDACVDCKWFQLFACFVEGGLSGGDHGSSSCVAYFSSVDVVRWRCGGQAKVLLESE